MRYNKRQESKKTSACIKERKPVCRAAALGMAGAVLALHAGTAAACIPADAAACPQGQQKLPVPHLTVDTGIPLTAEEGDKQASDSPEQESVLKRWDIDTGRLPPEEDDQIPSVPEEIREYFEEAVADTVEKYEGSTPPASDMSRYSLRSDAIRAEVMAKAHRLMKKESGRILDRMNSFALSFGGPAIAKMARSHQPGLLMVDRTIHGPYENYQTPERTVPETQLDFPWESCITLSDDWGWVPRPRWKSPEKVINLLIEIVAKGGSLVLGVGPTPEGLIQPEAVERLHAIGQWMRQNGRAIYNTRAVKHYHDGNVWFTGNKDGKTVYAFYLLPEGERLPAQVSWTGNLPGKGGSVRLVSNGKKLKYKVKDGKVTVTLPKNLPAQSVALEIR